MRIKWNIENNERAMGVIEVGFMPKYYVGPSFTTEPVILVADVRGKDTLWRNINIPVGTLEDGIQLCEMWEATGAY